MAHLAMIHITVAHTAMIHTTMVNGRRCAGGACCRRGMIHSSMIHSTVAHAAMASIVVAHTTVIHVTMIHAHGIHTAFSNRPAGRDGGAHSGPWRECAANKAAAIIAFGKEGISFVLFGLYNHIVTFCNGNTDFINGDRFYRLTVGRDNRHFQSRNTEIEIGHGGTVHQPQPDFFTRIKQSLPVHHRIPAIHQVGICAG